MPTTTYDKSLWERQLKLGHAIAGRSKIYLDTRFWIIARDVLAGTCTGAAERKLFHFLRRGVSAGRLVCPISESVVLEVMKQADRSSRQLTAEVIDELSLGISLAPLDLRLGLELKRLLDSDIRLPLGDLV